MRDAEGAWRADPEPKLLRGLTGKRKREGLEQLAKLAQIANFMERFLKIVRKDKRLELIRLNAAQEVILQAVASAWLWLVPAYLLLPKSRQMGVSTFWQAFFFARAILEPNYRVFTIANRTANTKEIFKMSRRFEENLPDNLKLPLRSKSQLGLEWIRGSSIQLETVGAGEGGGMGYTLQGFHGSEVAVWAKAGGDPVETWNGVSQAIAEDTDTTVAFESTPDGPDPFFYELVEESLAGEAGDWLTVFLPWYLEPSYALSVEDYTARIRSKNRDAEVDLDLTEEEQKLCELVAAQVVMPGEEWVRWPTDLSLEQLLWRRVTIANKCSGKVEFFNRYYPSTLEMAFMARQAQLFDRHSVDRLKGMRRPPARVGYLAEIRDVVTFRSRSADEFEAWQVEVWEEPEDGAEYVIGADVAEGVEDGDWSVAYVGKVLRDRGEVVFVARIHGHPAPDVFAEQLDLLGTWYYDALLAVETNRLFEVMRALQDREYPNLYWRVDASNPRSKSKRPGWHTSEQSRNWLLNCLRIMARDGLVSCFDHDLTREMSAMIPTRTPGGKVKWAARSGEHDDHVVAAGITLAVSGLCDHHKHRRRRGGGSMTPAEDTLLAKRQRNHRLARRSSLFAAREIGYSMG